MLLLALTAALVPALLAADCEKVNVTVYYESLCPDSQRFFNQQLYPVYTTPLGSCMNLTLVPYGNANTTSGGFVCQHGPTECYGNKVQACAILQMTSMDPRLRFLNCLMKEALQSKPTDQAAYDAIVTKCSADEAAGIKQCAGSTQADILLYKYGNMTKSADPPIKGVPTVFLNNKSSKEMNDAATKDLAKEVCKMLSNKPHECAGKGAATYLRVSTALLLLPAILLVSRLF